MTLRATNYCILFLFVSIIAAIPIINVAESSVYNSVGVRNLRWWAYGGVLFCSFFHPPLHILSVGTGPHNLGSVVGRVFIKQVLGL